MGQDVFGADFVPSTYITAYEDLVPIQDPYLTLTLPTKKVKKYALKLQASNLQADFQAYYDEIVVFDKTEHVNKWVAT